MWKWIVGVLGVLMLLVAGTCYWGYKRFTAGGNTATVTIKQSPERIFGMLIDPDSLATWSSNGRTTRTGSGALQVGDTLTVTSQATAGSDASVSITKWVVRIVQAPTLFVVDALSAPDSTGKSPVMFSRRDSLVSMGDSTKVLSTFTAPMMENIRQQVADSGGKVGTAAMGVVEKFLASAFRLVMQDDLDKLKLRVERP